MNYNQLKPKLSIFLVLFFFCLSNFICKTKNKTDKELLQFLNCLPENRKTELERLTTSFDLFLQNNGFENFSSFLKNTTEKDFSNFNFRKEEEDLFKDLEKTKFWDFVYTPYGKLDFELEPPREDSDLQSVFYQRKEKFLSDSTYYFLDYFKPGFTCLKELASKDPSILSYMDIKESIGEFPIQPFILNVLLTYHSFNEPIFKRIFILEVYLPFLRFWFSQNQKPELILAKELFKNRDQSKMAPAENELKKIKTILSKHDLHNCIGEKPNPKSFHLKDLDFDKKNDLIYNGGCDPYPRFQVFIQNKIGYERKFNAAAFLTKIEKLENKTRLLHRWEACCCLTLNFVGFVDFEKNKSTSSKLAAAHFELEIPENIRQPILFITAKETFLRNKPSEENGFKNDPCTDGRFYKNRLFEMNEETWGYILAEEENWCFVILEPGAKIIKNEFNQIDSNKNYIFGWIKKSDLIFY